MIHFYVNLGKENLASPMYGVPVSPSATSKIYICRKKPRWPDVFNEFCMGSGSGCTVPEALGEEKDQRLPDRLLRKSTKCATTERAFSLIFRRDELHGCTFTVNSPTRMYVSGKAPSHGLPYLAPNERRRATYAWIEEINHEGNSSSFSHFHQIILDDIPLIIRIIPFHNWANFPTLSAMGRRPR
jgi:hypothetical protein